MILCLDKSVDSGLGVPIERDWLSDDPFQGQLCRLVTVEDCALDRRGQERQLRPGADVGVRMPGGRSDFIQR